MFKFLITGLYLILIIQDAQPGKQTKHIYKAFIAEMYQFYSTQLCDIFTSTLSICTEKFSNTLFDQY